MYAESPALTIDLGAVRRNYRRIAAHVGTSCRAGAAVKANAYGLGVTETARALYAEGCRDFFVSSLEEGLALRDILSEPAVYVLNGFFGSAAAEYPARRLIPVLGSIYEIETYKAQGAQQGRALPAFLNFNIRMNRLGLGAAETEKILADLHVLDGIDVRGVMSHFACADEKDHPITATQHEVFEKIAAHFPKAQKSLANSSGVFRDVAYHYDLVRPGATLYGINPMPETANPMEPVVALDVPVIRLRRVYEGAQIGYGASYTFDKDTWVAAVAAGYADGIFRSLGNRGALYWKGYRCPIRGRVSMDLTTVDLSAVPESERPRPGDRMELIGLSQDVDALAKDAGTIGYEILTALGARYQRRYLDESTIRISGGKLASASGA